MMTELSDDERCSSAPFGILSIADIVDQQADRYPDAPALASHASGKWRVRNWREFAEHSKAAGLGLLSLGIVPSDVIAISSWTREEWLFVDVGGQGVGLVVAGIYPTETSERISYLLGDCGAVAVIVENQEHFERILPALSDCPSVKHVICIEPIRCHDANVSIVSFRSVLEAGREILLRSPEAWDAAREQVSPEKLAILIYTSGTTGDPKGAMITHTNIVHQALKSPQLFQMQKGWRRPCYLPLCHVAERMFTYFCLASAGISYFVSDPQQLNASLPEIKPNFILGVPRVYEKLREAVDKWLSQQPQQQVAQYNRDLVLCSRIAEAKLKGDWAVSESDEAAYLEACERHKGGVLQAVGLQDVCILTSGGVKFPDHLMVWFWAHGLQMFELYGMSETGIISTNTPGNVRLGSTGKSAGLGQVRIGSEGEVLVSGAQVFRGYLNKPEKNLEAFADGWFRTGDVGWFDERGYLYIVDRIKDILITGTGKNIAPSAIEAPLRNHPLISDVVLVGEGRNYLTALIVLDPVGVQASFPNKDFSECVGIDKLAADDEILEAVSKAIEACNDRVSRPEKIRKFRILPTVFASTDEEMTPTMKLRRNVIYRKYQRLIDEMYSTAI